MYKLTISVPDVETEIELDCTPMESKSTHYSEHPELCRIIRDMLTELSQRGGGTIILQLEDTGG